VTTKSDNLGINFDHTWARSAWATRVRIALMELVMKPVNRFFAPAVVTGLDHLTGLNGPVIFVANHSSHADTSTLLTRLPTRFTHHTVIAAAADYFFDTKRKAQFWALTLNAIPVERTKIDRRSAAVTQQLIEEGWNLIIFPEGGRTPDGNLQPFKPGAAFLAVRTHAPVIPIYLDGTREILAKSVPGQPKRHMVRRHQVTIAIGEPIVAREGENARRLAPRIEDAVVALSNGKATKAEPEPGSDD
jgi:1-acyl-sn-glycerol-3-phosphate acyltransferase